MSNDWDDIPSDDWLDQMAAERGSVTVTRGGTMYIVEVRKYDL